MGIRLIRKLPQRILDSVFSKLTIYQIMRLYHTADLDFESANERLRECCSQNRITNCHNLNNAEKIYRLILDKSSSFFPQNEPVLMTCNNFLQNLFLSKFTDLKTFNIEFIVTYGGMRDGIMEISIPSKSGDTGRIVVTIANDEKQFEDQETTKISLTLDVQKKDRRDTERRNAMFYDKKPDRLYCAQWKYDNTVDIHYMTPGQDQPVKVLSTPNTCVKLQSPHISVDQEHLFLIFSCQHDTYIMYYNAKTKECIWHEVNGHFQDMFQWANQLLIRTEDGLTHISADHTMLRSTWSTSISNSIRMTESVYAFHQNSYVSFAFIENGMFKIKKTMIYAGELAKLKRRCSSILTVKDGFGSNTYFFEVFNGNLVYDKISRRLVYDNASA